MGGAKKRSERDIRTCLISLAILKILSKKNLHGYALIGVLEEIFRQEISKPLVYIVLRRLEAKGLVKSRWETTDQGPARRVYFLTEEGKKAMLKKMKHLAELIEVCRRIIEY